MEDEKFKTTLTLKINEYSAVVSDSFAVRRNRLSLKFTFWSTIVIAVRPDLFLKAALSTWRPSNASSMTLSSPYK